MAEFVTRTVNATTVSALVYLREEKTTATRYFTLNGKVDNETALKFLAKKYNGPVMTVIDILESTVISQLRRMSLETFIENSEIVEAKDGESE